MGSNHGECGRIDERSEVVGSGDERHQDRAGAEGENLRVSTGQPTCSGETFFGETDACQCRRQYLGEDLVPDQGSRLHGATGKCVFVHVQASFKLEEGFGRWSMMV